MCPRWWNWVTLAYYMLRSSNHSGAPCRERCNFPCILKNPPVVFFRSRNHRAPPQRAKLPDPTHPSLFPVASIILLSCGPIHFSFHHNFMFILSPNSCSSPEYSCNIAAPALIHNDQSINSQFLTTATNKSAFWVCTTAPSSTFSFISTTYIGNIQYTFCVFFQLKECCCYS